MALLFEQRSPATAVHIASDGGGGRVLEGGVAGGVELQWSVVSGQWLETSAALAGMILEGGVAGDVPPHKGGPQARPPRKGVAPGGGGGLPTTALSRLSGEGCAGPP